MDLLLYCVCLCHIVLSVSCSLVVTCLERVDFLALLYVMFLCVFVTFPYGTLAQVWYLVVLIPDLCLLPYYNLVVEMKYICIDFIFRIFSVVIHTQSKSLKLLSWQFDFA